MIPDEPTDEIIANTAKSTTVMRRTNTGVFMSAFLLLLDGVKRKKHQLKSISVENILS